MTCSTTAWRRWSASRSSNVPSRRRGTSRRRGPSRRCRRAVGRAASGWRRHRPGRRRSWPAAGCGQPHPAAGQLGPSNDLNAEQSCGAAGTAIVVDSSVSPRFGGFALAIPSAARASSAVPAAACRPLVSAAKRSPPARPAACSPAAAAVPGALPGRRLFVHPSARVTSSRAPCAAAPPSAVCSVFSDSMIAFFNVLSAPHRCAERPHPEGARRCPGRTSGCLRRSAARRCRVSRRGSCSPG